MHPDHAVDRLRRQCEMESSREFKARGISLNRCPKCLLGEKTCICLWRQPQLIDTDVVLVMHRNEVYKPTNTGRLIADVFPDNCLAFRYDRLNPAPELTSLLSDPERQCVMIFPAVETSTAVSSLTAPSHSGARLTLILLDGTWKQASRMAAQAPWLKHIPRFDLAPAIENHQRSGHYHLRQADDQRRLSTAEAAALCLAEAGHQDPASILIDYFDVFNEHYVATRMNRVPGRTPAHERLEQRHR